MPTKYSSLVALAKEWRRQMIALQETLSESSVELQVRGDRDRGRLRAIQFWSKRPPVSEWPQIWCVTAENFPPEIPRDVVAKLLKNLETARRHQESLLKRAHAAESFEDLCNVATDFLKKEAIRKNLLQEIRYARCGYKCPRPKPLGKSPPPGSKERLAAAPIILNGRHLFPRELTDVLHEFANGPLEEVVITRRQLSMCRLFIEADQDIGRLTVFMDEMYIYIPGEPWEEKVRDCWTAFVDGLKALIEVEPATDHKVVVEEDLSVTVDGGKVKHKAEVKMLLAIAVLTAGQHPMTMDPKHFTAKAYRDGHDPALVTKMKKRLRKYPSFSYSGGVLKGLTIELQVSKEDVELFLRQLLGKEPRQPTQKSRNDRIPDALMKIRKHL